MKPILLLSLLFAFPSLAHQGHNHDAPATMNAPKGGLIQVTKDAVVEVLSKGNSIKIFLYGSALNALPLENFQVAATAIHPRSRKQSVISIAKTKEFFEGTHDAGGVHRYDLLVEITNSVSGLNEKLTFVIEPRK